MPFRFVVIALSTLVFSSGCVIQADGTDRPRPNSTRPTTAPVPEFIPLMSASTAEVLERDRFRDTSWQAYTYQFTDTADTQICSRDLLNSSPGTVVTIYLSGYEVEDEFAGCPVGNYRVASACDLFEGEACMEIAWRDVDGFDAGSEIATSGTINISREEARRGQPYLCFISTRVSGHPDMNFDFSVIFDEFELSPTSAGGPSCTL
jgi:hypothetical protein